MKKRLRKRGGSKIASRLLAACLTLSVGYAFGVFSLGGCGGASWPSKGQLPERVVERLTECGKKGPTPLQSVKYDLTFTAHVTEDGAEAHVDEVMLTDSTLHIDEVEACMTDALYGMRTPLSALALRRRKLAPDMNVAPEARALLGQAQLALLLEAVEVVVVGLAAYYVVVTFLVEKPRAKPRPRPVTEEPVVTEAPVASAAPTATAMPIATANPIATTMPTAAKGDHENDPCQIWLNECLENMDQPAWNQRDFGPMKDCGACARECRHKKGKWPDYKCPRN